MPTTKISKPKTPRSWRCSVCNERQTGTTKTCGSCRTRRGTKRTSLKARADRMASAIVKARANGKCEACGKEAPLDWAHGWPRRHHSLRWNTDAAFGLCRPCHMHYTNHPALWTLWLINRMGFDQVFEFERIANSQWDRSYERVLKELGALK